MTEDYFEIKDSTEGVVCMEGTPKKCTLQVHAKPMDALCISGAMTNSCIETYFNLAEAAGVPTSVAITSIKGAIEMAFENLGMEIDLDIYEK